MDEPLVPTPAPAVISPVGFSSTDIFIVLVFDFLSSMTSLLTFLKK